MLLHCVGKVGGVHIFTSILRASQGRDAFCAALRYLWDPLGPSVMFPCAMGCYGVLWDAMGCYGMLWDPMACYGILIACYGILIGCYGMLWQPGLAAGNCIDIGCHFCFVNFVHSGYIYYTPPLLTWCDHTTRKTRDPISTRKLNRFGPDQY
jgi:hypothetical protein